MERCDILLLQETLVTNYNGNELDLIAEGNITMSYIPAKPGTNLSGRRPPAELAMFRRSGNNFTCNTIQYTDRIMGLNFKTN